MCSATPCRHNSRGCALKNLAICRHGSLGRRSSLRCTECPEPSAHSDSSRRPMPHALLARHSRPPLSCIVAPVEAPLCILVFTTLPLFVDDDASHTFKLIKVLASRPPHSVIKQFRRQTMSNSGRRAYHPKTRISPNQLKTYHRPGPQFCS